MTNGEIKLLKDLERCYMATMKDVAEFDFLNFTSRSYKLDRDDKAQLRRLVHLYRNQIKAMNRNPATATPPAAAGDKRGLP